MKHSRFRQQRRQCRAVLCASAVLVLLSLLLFSYITLHTPLHEKHLSSVLLPLSTRDISSFSASPTPLHQSGAVGHNSSPLQHHLYSRYWPPETAYHFTEKVLRYLWSDNTTRVAPPSFHNAEKTGLVQRHTLPYPSDIDDQPNMTEIVYNTVEFFDPGLFITRYDFHRSPLVFSIGLENFADIRLTALTHSAMHLGTEERRALHRYYQNSSKETEALEYDHQQHARYYTYEHHHQENATYVPGVVLPYLSPPNASAPRNASAPASEVLTRMIQGDPAYDTLGVQLLEEEFPYERGMPITFRNHFCDRFIELLHLPDRPPLVVNVQKLHHFHFVVRCVYHRAKALATAKRQFVLLGTEIDETPSATFFFATGEINPANFTNVTLEYFINHPLLAHWYGTNGLIRHPKFTSLPIGFQFSYRDRGIQTIIDGIKAQIEERQQLTTKIFLGYANLSHMFLHSRQKLRFGVQSFMTIEKTLEVLVGSTVKPPVKVIPLDQLPERITTFYVVLMPIERYKRADRPSLTDDVIIFEEPSEANHHRTASVQHIALLPFTVALYHRILQNIYGHPAKDHKVVTGFKLEHWRIRWFLHINGTGMEALPEYGQSKYYEMIRNHTFVLSPQGKGYECYRTWESLSLGAIPITLNPLMLSSALTFEMQGAPLVDPLVLQEPYRGLPVIYVDEPEEVLPENLEMWRSEIYHRALQGEYQLEKLFMQYWVDKIYSHTNED